jgi:hypothetical protein
MLGKLLIAAGVLAPMTIAAAAYGERAWDRRTQALRGDIAAARMPVHPATVRFDELAALPAPVQRYFRTVLRDGMPMISSVRLRHRGTFKMGGEVARWKPFHSDQLVVTRRPGFDWDARIALLPGLPTHVHDAYVAGQGVLRAALLGMVTVADMDSTPQLAQGELMRFLAEAAWYPTALLPSQDVHWTAVDDDCARATMEDGGNSVTLLFRFNAQGLINSVQAEARGRTVGKRVIPTPWQGRFWNYQLRSGMLVPLEGEVAWLTDEGPMPYWRGSMMDISYELAN